MVIANCFRVSWCKFIMLGLPMFQMMVYINLPYVSVCKEGNKDMLYRWLDQVVFVLACVLQLM